MTNAIGGAALQGVTVTLGGMAAQTDASGQYTIANIPAHAYTVRASKPGYSTAAAPATIVAGPNSQSFTIKRNWVSLNGGATLASFSPPDNSAVGCGPYSAIDDSLASGWGSDSGTRQITIHLPQAVNLDATGGIAIDPKNTCTDPAQAALASYKVETSANGSTFSQVASGTFAAANNGHLNAVNPAGATNGVNYVRLTMLSSQGASIRMDMSELQVYGSPAGSAPPPTISGFTPSSGKTRTVVTITGTNLASATSVKLGSLPMAIITKAATQITAWVWDYNTYIPSAKISVTTPGGTVLSATNFTITFGISSVTPQTGPAGTNVTISGVGFSPTATVKFNTVPATVFARTGSTQIVAVVPSSATTGKITVTNTTGVTGTVTSWWTFTKT